MANKNDSQSAAANDLLSCIGKFRLKENATHSAPRCIHKAWLSRWRTDHEKARYAWDYRWGRNIDCGAALASMVAYESGAIACQRRSPRTAANCDERCRCQPKGVSPRIPQRGLRKCCWLRLWIVFRLWMSGVFQLLGTLRNKLRCTLRHLRQQLRHSLRASEIRLRRTVRTDFLLRVPAALVLVICAAPGVRCRWPSRGAYATRAVPDLCLGIGSERLES